MKIDKIVDKNVKLFKKILKQNLDDIEKQKAEEFCDKLYDSKILHDYRDGKIDFRYVREWVLNNYHAQFQPPVVTDREIEEVFEYYHPVIDEDEKRVCLKVAKWVRDKLTAK